jgi:hypothetical protein
MINRRPLRCLRDGLEPLLPFLTNCEFGHHDDIRNTLEELNGEGDVLSFEDTQVNPRNGQSHQIYRLPKRETLVLVQRDHAGQDHRPLARLLGARPALAVRCR